MRRAITIAAVILFAVLAFPFLVSAVLVVHWFFVLMWSGR